MPSMTAYSPYETLTLFQSIAKHGADASTFQDISSALIHSEFLSRNEHEDTERLSASALRGLYDELVGIEKGKSQVKVNGDISEDGRSPKRRKLSSSPESNYDEQLVQSLVEKLYMRYKEEAVKEIKRDEEAYVQLQVEIKSLESQVAADGQRAQAQPVKPEAGQSTQARSVGTVQPAEHSTPTLAVHAENPPAKKDSSISLQDGPDADQVKAPERTPSAGLTSGSATRRLQTGGLPEVGALQTPADRRQNESTQSVNNKSQQLQHGQPTAPPSRPTNYGTNQTQPGHHHGSHSPAPGPAPVQNVHQRQSPVRHNPSQGRGSPAHPQAQHPYPSYPPYPPQWHPHMQHQYPPHTPYPTHYYPSPVPGHHPQTPQQVPYQPYPHTVPVQYGQPNSWRNPPYMSQPSSAANTPVSRPANRASVTRSGSTTPWRKKRDPSIRHAASPTRPERAISPLVDDNSPPPETVKRKTDDSGRVERTKDSTPTQQAQGRRRGRPSSKTPSAMLTSRSQSNASHTSDTANENTANSRSRDNIKSEAPSTPLPPPSDTDIQRSSGRRGRPRAHTSTSRVELGRQNTAKRKRETISPSPSLRSSVNEVTTSSSRHVPAENHHPSLVVVSKNFSKTSQLLLSEITSHKLAGIFAKPLSERDAPGYKDLIYRPQDLKSIKAAISKGNRAALAAIEALETEGDHNTNPAHDGTSSGSLPGPLGNGFYLVNKSSDLVPPKGIANGAQLEMELIRMFANAIMFNPLPSSERGFGRHLKLRRNGGDVDPNRASTADLPDDQSDGDDGDHDRGASEGSSTTTAGGAGWDEGGIIADTREMFDDVVAAVGKWRSLEDERMGSSTTGPGGSQHIEHSRAASITTPMAGGGGGGGHLEVNTSTARQASLSASSNIADDEGGDGETTPVPTSVAGTARKRRRIGDH